MKALPKSLAQISGIVTWLLLAGCAGLSSQSGMPSTEAGIRQALLGKWYKPQVFVSGEERPPAGDEIDYRTDGTCTYHITSGPHDQDLAASGRKAESWAGHWRLEGAKLYRTWTPNWHFFAGQGPGNGEIVTLTSKEMSLRNDRSGILEHYYRQPRWDEREPIMLDNERTVRWY